MKRILGRAAAGLIVALVALYLGDWAVWRVRVARGGGMGAVTVNSIIVMPLKDSKEEYDWGGTNVVSCSQSIFPHSGGEACWWLRRHSNVFER